ncbi:MAG: rRNA maturation RNase YbeY [Proteobacteria bacterium]|nr:rRNA maturation RNase YbeY [Pseudomonadota bacterium]
MDIVHISYDEQTSPLSRELETSIADKLELLLKHLKVDDRFLSLFFCSEERIRELNFEYRNKNAPTDVLSWSYEDDTLENVPGFAPWGELVLCLDVVGKQAEESGWGLEDEAVRLLVHGIVHLLGYDHESATEEGKMLQLETELLSLIGLKEMYGK